MLSICLMAKNEGANLERCLKSITSADEIIVVDNGSSDNTKEIALKYANKVIYNDSSQLDDARESYMEAASKKWILVIDADEKIYNEDIQKIRCVLQTVDQSIWGFHLLRYDYCGYGKWAVIKLLRLFRNDKRIQYNKSPIHSSVYYSIIANGGKVSFLDIPIHHYDILLPGRTQRKREQYIRLIQEQLGKESQERTYSAALHNYLAAEYIALKEYALAEKELLYSRKIHDKAVDLSMLYLALCLYEQGRYREALEEVDKLLSMKRIEEVMHERAEILKAKLLYRESADACISFYKKILEKNDTSYNNLNYAYLLCAHDKAAARDLVNKAFLQNQSLNEKIIYGKPNLPNIFSYQNVFFDFSIRDLFAALNINQANLV